MASEVNIIISVKDLATAEINKIKASLKSLNKATKETADETVKDEKRAGDETEKQEKRKQGFLVASARAFYQLSSSMKFLYSGSLSGGILGSVASVGAFKFMEMGAQSDELRISFEKTFGSGAGSLLDNVRTSVKGIVDDTTIMKNAIQANVAGIKDISVLPQLFKMGAVASQRLGLDASEGIELARKAVVEFNEGAMEQLGIINKLDPAYKTQLAVIERTTKGLGAYMSIAQKVAYVQDQMAKRFGNTEVLEDNLQAFRVLTSAVINFKNNLMYIIGDALAPFLRHIATVTTEMVKFISQIRNSSAFKDGAMAIIRFTVALGGMITLLTIAKIAFMGLSLIFTGPFGLIGGFLALVGALKLSKSSSADFLETLSRLGKMATGIFQLLTSFDPNTGLAQINKDLADTLGPKTMQSVISIARAIENGIQFATGFAQGLEKVFNILVKIGEHLGFVNGDFHTWKDMGEIFGVMSAGLLGILTALKLINIAMAAFNIAAAPEILALLAVYTLYRGLTATDAENKRESDIREKEGKGRADYVSTPASSESGAMQLWHTISNTLSGTENVPSGPSPTSTPSVDNTTQLNKIANHLENIDNKTQRKNVFEDKKIGGSGGTY
jgi:hypothetical protein